MLVCTTSTKSASDLSNTSLLTKNVSNSGDAGSRPAKGTNTSGKYRLVLDTSRGNELLRCSGEGSEREQTLSFLNGGERDRSSGCGVFNVKIYNNVVGKRRQQVDKHVGTMNELKQFFCGEIENRLCML